MSGAGALSLEILGEEGRTLPLPGQGRLVIGSSAEHADVVLEGQGVDPAHCAVGRLREGGWAVKDLGSEYGTHVNGTRVASRRLAPGDVLVLGSRRLRVLDPDAAPPAEPPDETPRPAVEETRRVGGYRLERLIGRGRGGLVWLAVQESLHRPVALKILDPSLAADADFVGRFRSEARAAAALNHPNVVVVHDVGEEDGRHYLSMEYVPGGSLEDEVTTAGRLPWRRVLDVLHDAAGALEYAEKRGIVHRDVKPANLMRATGGSIKLADLGLATSIQAADADERVFGTPHFISPEQARGESVDHRSDLYSLGATAYRLLTGRTVFEGSDTRAILRAHFTAEPLPPGRHVPDLPAALEALVLRLLAKRPEERPASARTVLDEVGRLRAAADSAQWADGQDPRRSTRRLVGILVGSVLGAAALFVGLLFVARKIAPALEDDGPETVVPTETPTGAGGAPEDDGFFDPARTEDDPYAAVETRLERLDREAREALAALDPALTTVERRDELRSLARRFAGTETAEEASAELARLEEALADEAARETRLVGEAAVAGEALRHVAGWPPTPADQRTLRASMAAIRSYRPPREVWEHAAFEETREALEAEIATAALEAVQEGLRQADRLVERGAFDAIGPHLDELVRLYTPPAFVGGEPLPFAKTRLLLEEVSARRTGLEGERTRWLASATVADRQRLARAIDQGFLDDLAGVDLDALDERVDALEREVSSEHGAAFVAELRQDVAHARAALELIATALRAGEWRRRSVVDVRDGRGTVTVATAVPGGLVLEGAEAETVPWSRFGARAEWMHQLFHQRLDRDYTPAERGRIHALLRLTAVAQAARAAREALRSGRPAGDAVVEPFLRCTSCFGAAGDAADERAATELRAAEGLRRATRAAADETWSVTVATLETLLEQTGDSLLLSILSDGGGEQD